MSENEILQKQSTLQEYQQRSNAEDRTKAKKTLPSDLTHNLLSPPKASGRLINAIMYIR